MKSGFSGGAVVSWLAGVLLVLPVAAIFYTAIGDTDELFTHLMNTVLPTYVGNTLVLVAGVVLLTLIFGLPAAWLMAMCRVPGAALLEWLLILPLAFPGYIVGYIYTDLLDYAGPVQSALRDWFEWSQPQDYWFPDIRTLGGAIVVLSLVLYPYVYLLARMAFIEQSANLLQSARLLKASPWDSFRRISLPLARPAIAVALSLVAMEALGDFGTVSYFAVQTLTTAVYDTWLGYSSLTAAAKISALMLVAIFLLISAERYSRRRQKLFQKDLRRPENMRYPLRGGKKWLALIWCWSLVLFAVGLPLLQLAGYAFDYFLASWTREFRDYTFNSLLVALSAAVISVLIALVTAFYRRVVNRRLSVLPMGMASLGYAVPGTVLAIGVLLCLTTADHWLNDVAGYLGWGRPGLLFSGTLIALVFAFVVRFSAIAVGSVESSLGKVSPSLDMASRTLGYGTAAMLYRVHLPLIRRGCLIGALLVFIESMKELNAALLLRPFNFETLATYVYNFASDERLELAALPAILLVVVGMIPLILVNRSLEQQHL